MFNSGKSVINKALGSFKTISAELDKGITLSTTENTKKMKKLEDERKAFEKLKASIESEVSANEADIATAKIVKANIAKILTANI